MGAVQNPMRTIEYLLWPVDVLPLCKCERGFQLSPKMGSHRGRYIRKSKDRMEKREADACRGD
jgi:hypothetical protein